MFALAIQHIRMLLADLPAELAEMLRQGGIAGGSSNAVSECILSGLQIAGCFFPLMQLLIGGGSVPECDRPLQAVRLNGACRQQRNLAVKRFERLFWLTRNGQQSDAIFIVGHDARHALGGWAVFGRIELGLASRDRSCVLGLQQLRASWIPILSVRS